jgi:peptide-methionine (S)-S-oxide reductase
VAKKRIPARSASTAVAATVVAPLPPAAKTAGRSRTPHLATPEPAATIPSPASSSPIRTSPRTTAIVAGTAPASRTVASHARATRRLSGRGSPWATIVLSSATTGAPRSSASATSACTTMGAAPYPGGTMFLSRHKTTLVDPADALPGREQPIVAPGRHDVLGTPIAPPFPDNLEQAVFGMGCFWGAERVFWRAPGVYTTAVGYAGGFTPNPTYEEVCSGRTGHTEAVLVVFDPAATSYEEMLRLFWENHDPTQGMRQGNDVGTQYRSAVYWETPEQREAVEQTREAFAAKLRESGYGDITTEVAEAGPFYYAEDYHQQYLAKNPNGYCGLGGTGVSCPIGLST